MQVNAREANKELATECRWIDKCPIREWASHSCMSSLLHVLHTSVFWQLPRMQDRASKGTEGQREQHDSPLQPPGQLCVSDLLCEGHNTLRRSLSTTDVVPVVPQHVLAGGSQACGTQPLSLQGPAVLSTEGTQHRHNDKGCQHSLDHVGQGTSP